MEKLSQEYLLLFNTITDAEASLKQLRERLLFAQCQAEELYLRSGEPVREGGVRRG